MMGLRKNVILRSPRSGRLEGRTASAATDADRLKSGSRSLLRRRRALGAAQFGEGVAAGEEGFDVAGGLAQALAVLDQRDAHEALAVLAEADPRRDRDIGAFEEELREGEGADAAEFLGDRRPGEHRGG